MAITAGSTSTSASSFLISTPVGFVGGGLALAVAWTAFPGAHWFLGLLVAVIFLGLVLSHMAEVGSQFKAMAGWTGHKEKIG